MASVASAAERDRGPEDSSERRLSRDEVFDVLSSRRRRNVVHALRESEAEPASVNELSRRLAAWENDHEHERDVTAKERKRVYTALRQTHLPKLHEVGVVEYDADRGTVALSPSVADLEPYLREPDRRSWALYYVAIGAAGLVLSLAAGSLGGVDGVGAPIGALVSLAVLVVAGVHYWYGRPGTRDRVGSLADAASAFGTDGTCGSESDEN